MRQQQWTEEEIKILLAMEGKFGPSEIGKKLGRSRDSVRHKIISLKRSGDRPARVSRTHKETISYPSMETPKKTVRYDPDKECSIVWCPNCKSPVSNWDDHLGRMSVFGCRRP